MLNKEINHYLSKLSILNDITPFDIDKIQIIGECFKKIITQLSNEFSLKYWKERNLNIYFPTLDISIITSVFDSWMNILFSNQNNISMEKYYENTLWSLGELYEKNQISPMIVSEGIRFMQLKTQDFINDSHNPLPIHSRLELAASTFKTLTMNESILNHCVV